MIVSVLWHLRKFSELLTLVFPRLNQIYVQLFQL